MLKKSNFFYTRGSYNIINMNTKIIKKFISSQELIKSWEQKFWQKIFGGPIVAEFSFLSNSLEAENFTLRWINGVYGIQTLVLHIKCNVFTNWVKLIETIAKKVYRIKNKI
jgi:hypothetical protein